MKHLLVSPKKMDDEPTALDGRFSHMYIQKEVSTLAWPGPLLNKVSRAQFACRLGADL